MRRRTCPFNSMLLLCAALAPGVAAAQLAPAPSPSPLAPGTLKAPVFDTTTHVYNSRTTPEQSANIIVAEVDGRAVTLGEVGDAVRDLPKSVQSLPYTELFPIVLDDLVRREALVIRAQHQRLDEDPAIRREMKAAADRVLANAVVRREASSAITEQALLDRYNRDIAGKPGPEEVRLQVIMVPTEAAAKAIIGELGAGGDFATIAKRSSKDATAPAGGDVGFVARGAMNPELDAVAFATPPGQLAPAPVLSDGNWFVIKVNERRTQPTPPFSAVRERLLQTMIREAAPGIVKQALANVTIREYSIAGKDAAAGPGATTGATVSGAQR